MDLSKFYEDAGLYRLLLEAPSRILTPEVFQYGNRLAATLISEGRRLGLSEQEIAQAGGPGCTQLDSWVDEEERLLVRWPLLAELVKFMRSRGGQFEGRQELKGISMRRGEEFFAAALKNRTDNLWELVGALNEFSLECAGIEARSPNLVSSEGVRSYVFGYCSTVDRERLFDLPGEPWQG